jgi:hypothetical protein
MAVVMVYACTTRGTPSEFGFFFPVEIRWIVLLYVLFDLHPVLLSLAASTPPMALRMRRIWAGWRSGFCIGGSNGGSSRCGIVCRAAEASQGVAKRPEGRSSADREATKDAEVDRILDKIMQQGLESLTEREKRALDQASQRYRERES